MSEAVGNALERRVLVLGPNARDEQFTRVVLEEVGIPCVPCRAGIASSGSSIGAGAVIVAEEAILRDGYEPLKTRSIDSPLVRSSVDLVVTSSGADSPAGAEEAVADLGNVSLLERPVRVSALVSAVRTALRARSRQYQPELTCTNVSGPPRHCRRPTGARMSSLAVLRMSCGIRSLRFATRVERHEIGGSGRRRCRRNGRHAASGRSSTWCGSSTISSRSRASRKATNRSIHRAHRSLAAVIRQAVETSHPRLTRWARSLELDVDAEPLWVAADPIRLTQVFANILNNASKFSEDGGVIRLTGDVVAATRRKFRSGISERASRKRRSRASLTCSAQGTRNAPRNMGASGSD